jgi:hypothetical protein
MTQVIEPDPFLLYGIGLKVGMAVRQQSTAPHHQIGLNLCCSAVRLFLALSGISICGVMSAAGQS